MGNPSDCLYLGVGQEAAHIDRGGHQGEARAGQDHQDVAVAGLCRSCSLDDGNPPLRVGLGTGGTAAAGLQGRGQGAGRISCTNLWMVG